MKKITLHEEAASEIKEAALYYEERAPGLRHSFLNELEKAVDQVSENPEVCPLVGDEVRRKLPKSFPL